MKIKQIKEKYGEIEDETVKNIMKVLFSESVKYDSMVLTEVAFENVYKYIRTLEQKTKK